MKTLFSLIKSPFHPDFSAYQKLSIAAERFDSARNLHRALQKQPPDFFVGEFIYGWGNNAAGRTSRTWISRSGCCNAFHGRQR
ncbi:MAG: hypothetical protein LC646_10645 [Xanthomonadaceae bacterium]|nr:hypothetical protein [Xanthomonadaceae bacterium]